MKDWRGVEVKVGDRVMYATRMGSSMTIVEGNVLAIEPSTYTPYGQDQWHQAVVDVVNESGGWKFQPRKKPARVGHRYLTVVTGLPEATSDAS